MKKIIPFKEVGMKKILFVIMVIIATASVFAGCTKESEQQDTPQTKTAQAETAAAVQTAAPEQTQAEEKDSVLIEPEQLLSKEEATSLIGETVKDGEKSEQAVVGLKICMYEAADENSFRFIQISLTQQDFMPENGQTPEAIYRGVVSGFDGGEKVDGIGDEAVFAVPGIHITADGYYIVIGAGNSDDEAVREVLKKAGSLAVANLKKLLD